ncbi:hypothetical protein AB1H94_07860 [Pseudomonas fulva]|uniref:hypothetical protein n=1 Tax=Pseudomonas TaxID=286 RepID=UPI0011B09CCC|nr:MULTISPECIES: hypothetical protein [Pseudomonas]
MATLPIHIAAFIAAKARAKQAKLEAKRLPKKEIFVRYTDNLMQGDPSFRTVLLPTDTDINNLMNHLARRSLLFFESRPYKYFWFRTNNHIVLGLSGNRASCLFFDSYLDHAVNCGYCTSYKVRQKMASAELFKACLLKYWQNRSSITTGRHSYGGTRIATSP